MAFPNISLDLHVFTATEIRVAFESNTPIYFDTMVLQNLWKLHSNPRKSLLESIKAQATRSYLPYQTQVELYRHAYTESVLGNVPTPGLFESNSLLEKAQDYILKELEKVRPLGQDEGPSTEGIEELKAEVAGKFKDVIEWHASVDEKLRQWLGERPDVIGIRRGATPHFLLDTVADAFEEDHILPQVKDERRKVWAQEYQDRVNQDDPVGPGKTDKNKESIDIAAGDYFMWREIVEHCSANRFSDGFIFVTDERKPDLWETQQTDKAIRRIDPRIQKQAIKDTGGPMYVVSFDEFIEYTTDDDRTRQMLVGISEDAQRSSEPTVGWAVESYAALLELLHEWGNDGQKEVIVAAAREGGSISREAIGNVLGWDGKKGYLTRFRMPADRAKRELVQDNVVEENAPDPLWAVYNGPGEAVAYAVPDKFVALQAKLDADERR